MQLEDQRQRAIPFGIERKRKRGARHTASSLTALLCLMQSGRAALSGVGYQNSTTFTGDVKCSMMGGAELFVRGSGFATEAPNNYPQYVVESYNNVLVQGPSISDNDSFSTNTKTGWLATRAPSLLDALGAQWSDFDGSGQLPSGQDGDEIKLRLEIATASETLACGSSSACKLKYKRDYTPILHDVVPNQVYAGMRVDWWFDVMDVHGSSITPDDFYPMQELSIDRSNVFWEGLLNHQTRLSKYQLGKLPAIVGDQKANKNSDVVARFRSGHAYKRSTSQHCNFAGDDCWYVRTHPKIESISSTTGSSEGGQTVSISGISLGAINPSVTVDGVDCVVQTQSSTEVTCETGEKPSPTASGAERPGQPGLLKTIYSNNGSKPGFNDFSGNVLEEYLTTSFETTERYEIVDDDNADQDNALDAAYGNRVSVQSSDYLTKLDGWLKAPGSGSVQVRFYISCDDDCQLELDSSNPYGSGSYSLSTVVSNGSSMTFRNYNAKAGGSYTDEVKKSSWITLTGGQYYRIRGQHRQDSGDAFFTVSMEVKDAYTEGHTSAMREIQQFTIDQDQTPEVWLLEFIEPDFTTDDAGFFITFTGNDGKTYATEENFKFDVSAADLQKEINQDYYNQWRDGTPGYNVVTRYDYDENDELTSEQALIKRTVFHFTLSLRITGYSFQAVEVTIFNAATTSEVYTPAEGSEGAVASSAPLAGYFTITCTDPYTNVPITSGNMHWAINGDDFAEQLQEQIPFLASATIGFTGTPVGDQRSYWQNYRRLYVEFKDLLKPLDQCTIQSATDSIENQLTGFNPTFSSATQSDFGSNLFFEPIPMEMLFTSVTKPQVLMEINGLEALCANANCDYEYVVPSSDITSFTVSGTDVSITGTSLPTSDLTVEFGGATCGTVSSDGTTATCTLSHEPRGGDHLIEMRDVNGLVPISASAQTIAVSVTSISPDTDINPNGGDLFTIVGTGFPNGAAFTQVEFDDGTFCTIQTSTPTQIECIIDGFVMPADPSTPIKFSIDYLAPSTARRLRGVRRALFNLFPPSPGIDVLPSPTFPSVTTVSPMTVNPVIKSHIVFTIADYPHTLVAEEFKVILLSLDDALTMRELNIVGVDDAAKTVTAYFPGASSGLYTYKVEGKDGYLSCTTDICKLQTIMQVTDFQPRTGSKLGGTLVTITGNHFSTSATDNPVKLGNNYCYVIETGDTEIKCRVGDLASQDPEEGLLLVFARTTEEMVCNLDDGADCIYEYVAPTGTISGLSSTFDTSLNAIKLTVSGQSLGDQADDVILTLDGIEQPVIAATQSSVTFQVTDALDTAISEVKFYNAEGTINGADGIATTSLTPGLVSITPSTGSSGGAKLTVTGVGFGVNTEDIQLFHVESSQDICDKVEVVSYGVFYCYTIVQQIQATDSLKVKIGGQQYSCLNTQSASDCTFEALDATSPQWNYVKSVDGNTLEFEGSLLTATDSIDCVYLGVTGTGVSSDGDTKVTCTFVNGVPVSDSSSTPKVIFHTDAGALENTALYVELVGGTGGGSGFSKPIDTAIGASGVECSFEGGCLYSITGDGITGALAGDNANKVTVCGNECVLDLDESDSTAAKCRLPAVVTTYSNKEYNMREYELLVGTWSGTGDSAQLSKLQDGDYLDDYVDGSIPCEFSISARDGYDYQIEMAKVFIDNLQDKSPYDSFFHFEGDDDTSPIYTFDGETHEGWNVIKAEEDNPWSYNTYRFRGTESGSCRVSEIELYAVEVIDDSETSYQCTPKITIGETSIDLTKVTYTNDRTPVLEAINPRFGSVRTQESVTFTGTGFIGTATVLIDDLPCDVTYQDDIRIICTTSLKPSSANQDHHPSLSINIEGVGDVATQGLVYRYVSRWSEKETWGGDFPPDEGDAVSIPVGLNLLVDVDSTPVLSFLTVEGSLIFAPDDNDENHERSFDAQYIIINGGYMEVGTEDFPYTSKLTITMHGDEYTPQLPIYGNKCIAVRNGLLEMHGKPVSHTWTDLWETANAGDSCITLNSVEGGPELSWQVGDEIAIASTDFIGSHAEKRTVTSIADNTTKPVVCLDSPLAYKHYAGVEQFGDDTLEMRAEVGLLTRSVKFRGDPETSVENQYGAHIMMASPGNESVIGKIEHIEVTDAGQAFKLGRYPIHFHMIGTVQKSYIKHNSIHQTYNRACTLHGVHYLTIQNNFAYKNMGHAIFIEDAIETKNRIDHNLVMDTRESNSLLNTDQTPASFWITNPDNIFTNNHAAGSIRYGFWFDLQEHPTGPSFDPNVCPENTKLGEFRDNVSHSNGRYGLRIFHQLIPREKPCQGLSYNANSVNNPFGNNKPIIANFYNHLSYKNGRAGIIMERAAAVQFHNAKGTDNKLSCIEIFDAQAVPANDYTKVVNALCVGRSANREEGINSASPIGVWGPKSEWFSVEDSKFFNYDFNTAACFSDCSHCWHPASTDQGARTVTTKNLFFDSTATNNRIRYGYPFRGIFYDTDGTLTGLGPDTFATMDLKHNHWDECTVSSDHGGLICDDTVAVRAVIFKDFLPSTEEDIYVSQLPNELEADLKAISEDDNDAFQAHLEDEGNFQNRWKVNKWAVPYVTKHRYNLHFGKGYLDWEALTMELSPLWEPDDASVLFHAMHIDVREQINFYAVDQGMRQIANMTYFDTRESGANYVYNDTDTREFGWQATAQGSNVRTVFIEGIRCVNPDCDLESVEELPISDEIKYWSNATTWPDGEMPTGGNVEVLPGENIVFDLEDSPLYEVITVNGQLSFLDDAPYLPKLNLNAEHIFVRAGYLLIGSEEAPYQAEAQITLHGSKLDAAIKMSGTVETGNKVIANTGLVELHGKPKTYMSRLMSSISKGERVTLVDLNLGWEAGDKIFFGPTTNDYNSHDYSEISNYYPDTGRLELTEAVDHYHFGDYSSTGSDFDGVDMRGEVILLSRNVKITGDSSNDHGCATVTSDRTEADRSVRKGRAIFDNVEFYRCGQADTFKTAIRYEGARLSSESKVMNTVVWGGNGKNMLIKLSNNIEVTNSAFIGGFQFSVILTSVDNVHLDSVYVGHLSRRIPTSIENASKLDPEGGIAFCSLVAANKCPNSSVKNSIVTGVIYAGFIAPGNDCVGSGTKFSGNVAHSNNGVGAHIFPDPASPRQGTCYEGKNFSAYKNREPPVSTMYFTGEMRMSDMVFIDSNQGFSLNISGERDEVRIYINNIKMYGEPDINLDCHTGQICICPEKTAMMLFSGQTGGKPLHPTMLSSLPIHKIKSDATWATEVVLNRVEYINFARKTKCGKKQILMNRNQSSADYIPVHHFKTANFKNVAEENMFFLSKPPKNWANKSDCHEWPCTAPRNVVLKFQSTQFSGDTQPVNIAQNFQVVSKLAGVSDIYDGCTDVSYWNAAFCQNEYLGVLLMESLDADTFDRTVQPVYLRNEKMGFENKVNSFMDHIWDGFYTGQLRMSRFPIQMQTEEDYTIYMTGTPPNAMRYVLRADRGATKLRLYYPKAGAYKVYANGEEKPYTPWSQALGRPEPLKKRSGCGENRFVGVENFLEFYLTTDCEIRVEPYDQIFSKVRLSWTTDEFYADGGVNSFTDRVAGALGIEAWRIKVVAAYEGSVIIEFFLVSDEDLEEDSVDELRKKGKLLAKKLADTEAPWLGAPIISVVTNGETLVDNTSLYDGNSGTATLIDEFLEERDGKLDDDENVVVVITPVEDDDPSDVIDENVDLPDNSDSVDNENEENEGGETDSDSNVVVTVTKDNSTSGRVTTVANEDNNSVTDSENFIIIILVVIAAFILLILVICLVRLFVKPHQKITINAQTAIFNDGGKKSIKSMASQPPMDPQFVADNLDMLEITKKRRANGENGTYSSLPDDSVRMSRQSNRSGGANVGEPADDPHFQETPQDATERDQQTLDVQKEDSSLPSIVKKQGTSEPIADII